MKDIEQYKQRFFNLMESTMGDVKPLISEQGDTKSVGNPELAGKIIKEEEGEMAPPQNDSKIKELLGGLTRNLWHQLGTGDYKKPQMDSVLYDAARNVSVNGKTLPGLFVFRKKRTNVGKHEGQFTHGEIALNKDKKNVNLYNGSVFKQYNLDDDTSFNELMNLISSKQFTQY